MLTRGAMSCCGLTSLVVCIDDKFRDIRECVTLWRLILRSLGCNISRMIEADEVGLQDNPRCNATGRNASKREKI